MVDGPLEGTSEERERSSTRSAEVVEEKSRRRTSRLRITSKTRIASSKTSQNDDRTFLMFYIVFTLFSIFFALSFVTIRVPFII